MKPRTKFCAAALLMLLTLSAQLAFTQNLEDVDGSFDTGFGYPGLDLFVKATTAGETGVYFGGSFKSVAKLDIEGLTRFDGKRFYGMGVRGAVSTIAAANGFVYAGGSFTVDARGITARGIAQWDERNRQWRTVGSGTGPQTGDRRAGSIHAMAIAGSNLYVAGNFASIDGVAAAGVARWNGSTWSAVVRRVGNSSTDAVYALAALPDGRILVGGTFDQITALDGTRANVRSFAAYEPETNRWSSFAGGLGGDFFDAEVYAIAIDGNRVYVGGEFVEAGTIAASHIAMWDGSRWSALGGGVEEDGYVETIALHQGVLYIGGGFGRVGGTRAFNVARWDGSRWSGLGGTDDSVNGLAVFAGELYLGGDFEEAGDLTVEYGARWTIENQTWRGLGEGLAWASLTGEVSTIVTDAEGRIFVGGNFTLAGGKEMEDLAMWDGRTWQPLGEGVNNLVNTLLISGDYLYVGGAFSQAGGRTAGGIARWNLKSGEWSTLGSGVNRSVFVLEPGPDGTIYVGGHFSSAGNTDARNLAIFDPATHTWAKTPFDFPVAVFSGCYCVMALKATPQGVLVAGRFPHIEANGQRVEAQSIFYWNRTEEQISVFGIGASEFTGNLDVTGTVNALHVTPEGELFIGGHFDKIAGVGARHVARLSAAGWQALGEGLSHEDRLEDPAALAFLQTGKRMLVVGRFTAAGEAQSRHAAIWDMETAKWLEFGTGFAGEREEQVATVTVAPDGAWLFGGEFVLAGNRPEASLARWKPAMEVVLPIAKEIGYAPALLH